MKVTALRATVILAFLLSVSFVPPQALGQGQPGKFVHPGEEGGLALDIAACESYARETPGSEPLPIRKSFPITNSDMLDLGVLGHWSNPRVNMTCQYGAFCPSTYCTSP